MQSAILTQFHEVRREDVESGKSPSAKESLDRLQGQGKQADCRSHTGGFGLRNVLATCSVPTARPRIPGGY